MGAISDRRETHSSIPAAPKPQLRLTQTGWACIIDARNASSVCPLRVRPLSVSVADTITGTFTPVASIAACAASSAALAFNVSNIVSMSNKSAPPSISPVIWSVYVSTSSSHEMLLAAGSSTDGEIDRLRLVGPTLPATQHLCPSAAVRAKRAAARFISRTYFSRP